MTLRKRTTSKKRGSLDRQTKVLKCNNRHIARLRSEVRRVGLFLRDTTGKSQRHTLLALLQYLGVRGLNTLEGVGLGFYRIATRVQELQKAGYPIASHPECVEGPDGLVHCRIARYIFGKHQDDAQSKLDFDH